ncbi:MAG: quinone-dependent dihydroorotate dehydrogenase [Gammaproteobacteria bacterium]|nr:quinone-dependent dihydroorotate dehydrogenase [Gammaproteobacteria bacterium]
MNLPYRLARPLLFLLNPEHAHQLSLALLSRMPWLVGTRPAPDPVLHTSLAGLALENPLGLAAGLDKEGCCTAAWQRMGFGFVELGTVTPKPQPGNPRPRLFRLPAERALINRMGFNSGGLTAFVPRLEQSRTPLPRGINLGRNADTPNALAARDYRTGLAAVYRYAAYVVLNVSSPNTTGLRELQDVEALAGLLAEVAARRDELAQQYARQVPVLVKIAPDLSPDAARQAARLVRQTGLDGVIATNTTLARPGLEADRRAGEAGGLSGAPLAELAAATLAAVVDELAGAVPVIASGGIFDGEQAWQRLAAGASAVQIYTALIYEGPAVVGRILAELSRRVHAARASSLEQALSGERAARQT